MLAGGGWWLLHSGREVCAQKKAGQKKRVLPSLANSACYRQESGGGSGRFISLWILQPMAFIQAKILTTVSTCTSFPEAPNLVVLVLFLSYVSRRTDFIVTGT